VTKAEQGGGADPGVAGKNIVTEYQPDRKVSYLWQFEQLL
jgi:hypothetical protein